MDAKEMNKLMIIEFPNLADAYRDEVNWQEGDDTGSHTVYGDVFTPYFMKQILDGNEREIIKILNFLERILCYASLYSEEVVAFSVLESVIQKFGEMDLLTRNYGNKTKSVVNELVDKNR